MNKLFKLLNGAYIKEMYASKKRDYKVWLFGEWFGKRCCDNSLYFANYVSENHPEIHVYWACFPETDTTSLNNRVNKVFIGTRDALDVYKKAGVVVLSQRMADFSEEGWNYFKGAITVNLWHGVPWKKIGHDAAKKRGLSVKIYSRISDYIFGANYYASPSDQYDIIASSAFNAKKRSLIHVGYARNSIFYHKEKIAKEKSLVLNKLKLISPDFDFTKCKIVTYMPTFRNSKERSRSISELKSNTTFIKYINENNIIVVQKAHFVNQSRHGFDKNGNDDRFYDLNDISAQSLLCATDLLVTDYSGAFFDFSILDRPIVHYLYDYEYYKNEDKGLYYEKDDIIAGEEADDADSLARAIINNIENPDLYKDRRRMVRNIYMKYDTENSCDVLFDEIGKRCSKGMPK